MTTDEAVAAGSSVAVGVTLRDETGAMHETGSVHERILSGLRAERLLGVVAHDEAAASIGQGFASLLSDAAGRPLVVRDDGIAVGIDPETVAARLHRRLDAAVQLSVDEDALVAESVPQDFAPWEVLPAREEAAARRSVRWIAVLPEPADIAVRWLTELATLVAGDVVLVPAGDRSLLVCDAWRFAVWPSELRPLIGIAEVGSEIQLHAWLQRRLDAAGRSRRRLMPTPVPDWSMTWAAPPAGVMPPEGYPGMAADAIAAWRAPQSDLVERLEPALPQSVASELQLGRRGAALERLLALDPPAVTTAAIVEALGLPEIVTALVRREVDPASIPGARSASRQSFGRTLLGSMRDEVRHGDRSAEGIRVGVAVGSFLVIGLAVALLARFGIITREQIEDPWFFAVLAIVGILCAVLGQVVAARVGRRRRRRSPVAEE
ncbi:hypothetical protein [Agrococcus sp. DT81.2]|uniref:hypothetical protein n=1 Tax=Agrococcus sp. DT81.2 TaxID=3393414 RepID=UPI003CE485C9